MKKIQKKYISIFILFLSLLFFLSIIFSIININNDRIIFGIYINDVNVSNLSKEEAKELLIKNTDDKKSSNFIINCISSQDNSILYSTENSYSSLNINYDITNAIDEAYNVGRNNNIFKNNYSILSTLLTHRNITMNFTFNEDSISQIENKISSELPDKFIDSSYYIEDSNLIILKGSSGNSIDNNTLKNNILSSISNLNLNNEINIYNKLEIPKEINIYEIHSKIVTQAKDAYYEENPFKVYQEINGIDFDLESAKKILENDFSEYTIPLTVTTPKITLKNLNINIFPDLLATFSTKYDAQNINRETNIQLAVSKINGYVLSPNKQFSYNSIVGERSISAGYKESKIYSNGEVVDGIGGGICQVSSTLYNVAIFANLEINERHNHQFVTSYVDPGRDATVVYGIKDLKFTNSRTYPIKINASAKDGIVKISVYGLKEENEYDISFDNEVLSTIPYSIKYEYNSETPSDYIKRLGANGALVDTYRVVKLNGSIVSKTLLSQDKYNSLDRIIVKSN